METIRNGSYYGSDLNFSLLIFLCSIPKKYWKDKPGEYVVGHYRLSLEAKNHVFFPKNSWVFSQSPWLCTIYPKHWSFENLESDSF